MAEKNSRPTIALEMKSGSFIYSGTEYTYEITNEEGNDKYVASYTPFLKHDDKTLLVAILEAFKTTYGSDAQITPTPLLESRNGTNLIKFAGDVQNYYVLSIKELEFTGKPSGPPYHVAPSANTIQYLVPKPLPCKLQVIKIR